jgi:2-oxoglutarate dehydrogenase E2 component (dihydrolipoamide succinyltransferase)
VPVVRDADVSTSPASKRASAISASKARDGKLSMADLQGGTFTISNGGVYGSLMSTPILNPPQSASSACTRSRSGPWWWAADQSAR